MASISALPKTTRAWRLQVPPSASSPLSVPSAEGAFNASSTFALDSQVPLPERLGKGELLLRTRYLSHDPAQRILIAAESQGKDTHLGTIPVGEPIKAFGAIFEVVAVADDDDDAQASSRNIRPGDLVTSWGAAWVEHVVVPAGKVTKLELLPGFPPTIFINALGAAGITAYWGLTGVTNVKAGEVVVVSSAAGAIGSLAVQIAAKILGAKVIGIAGGPEKCRWVELSLGAARCVDYKSARFEAELAAAVKELSGGKGIDIYFDNVAGKILNAILPHMNDYGRIAACGVLAGVDDPSEYVMTNWLDLVMRKVRVIGFTALELYNKPKEFGEALKLLREAILDGTLVVSSSSARPDASGGAGGMDTLVGAPFEAIPHTWGKLFDGSARGKVMSEVI